jgi:hypothetical protein
VKQENLDFYKKDINVRKKYYANTPGVYWMCVEDDVTLRAQGWTDLEKFVGDWMKENPQSDTVENNAIYANFHSVVADSMAFLRYTKRVQKEKGEKFTLEQRTFQYIDNSWKVIGMTSAPGHSSEGSTANVFVHGPAK